MRNDAAVIFDLDGTLVDSLPDISDAMNRVLADHQQPFRPTRPTVALIDNGIRSMVDRLVPHYHSIHQQVLFDEFIARYSGHLFERSVCYPGMVELVAKLRSAGYTRAIFSNKRHDLTNVLVAHFFQLDDFRVVRGHIEGRERKPHPTPTIELPSDLVVESPQCVVSRRHGD